MEQKVAIVTGASSGLGLAIAKKFTAQHIYTVLIGRDIQKLEEARRAMSGPCEVVAFDLTNLAGVPAMVEQLVSRLGHIDILVNNAGINQKKPLLQVSDDDFQSILATNVSSVFALSREVLKPMVQRGSGNIINISSMAAQYGLPYVIAYSASKTAIEGMTRAMAVELAPQGIRVNCIAPGFIATNMSAKALDNDPERKQRVLARTPMGKLGSPDDVANLAYFLASDDAGFVTGTVVPVDGGNSIGF